MEIRQDTARIAVSLTLEEAIAVCQQLVNDYPVSEGSDFYRHEVMSHMPQIAAVLMVITCGEVTDPSVQLYILASLVRRAIEVTRETQQPE